jgi:hypothetical protein
VLTLADCEEVAQLATAARSAGDVEAIVITKLAPKLRTLWRERGFE